MLSGSLQRWLEKVPSLEDIITNIGWLFVDKILRMVAGLIASIWVARYLGPEQFGKIAYVLALVAIFQAIVPMGLDNIAIRDISKNRNHAHETLGNVVAVRIAASLFCYASVVLFSLIFHGDDGAVLILTSIIAASLFLQPAETIELWFQSQLKIRKTIPLKLCAYILVTGIKFALVFTGQPITAFAWIILFESAMYATVLYLAYFSYQTPQKWNYNRLNIKPMLREGMPFLISGVFLTLYLQIDRIILEKMAGSAEVGFYYSALAISQAFNFLPLIICGSLAPKMATLSSITERNYFFIRLIALIGSGAIAISSILYVFSDFIIFFLYGYTYNKATEVLSITSFAIVPVFLSVVNDYFTLSIGKSYITLIRTASGLLLSVSLNFILIPKYGALGSAISFLAAHLLSNTILYWILVPGYLNLFYQAIKYPISMAKYLK